MAEFLVVGGKGFLGKSFTEVASKRGHACVVLDKDEIDVLAGPDQLADAFRSHPGSHALLLASRVGAKTFEETPAAAWLDNSRMLANMVEAAATAGRSLASVSWFSTSEVYGSRRRAIKTQTQPSMPDYRNPRSLYAQCKLAGETAFRELCRSSCVEKLRIFRPFNVFGPDQKRGVVYDMVKSALERGEICYSANTDRTLTPAGYFADVVERVAVSDVQLATVDVAWRHGSITMKLLAKTIAGLLELWSYANDVRLVELAPDPSIQRRHVSRVHWLSIPTEFKTELSDCVVALAEKIKHGA